MSSARASGAKGIVSYEHNLSKGYLPEESSIEHEGIFYDYYFRTPKTDKHLEVSYSFAITKDPLSNEQEIYLGVGIGSKLDGKGLKLHGGRSPLNMVICLDISGSMASGFSRDEQQSKLELAKSSILYLLSTLKPNDSFSLVLFDTVADVIQPLQLSSKLSINDLKEQVMKIKTRGGTSIEAGMKASAAQFDNITMDPKIENRIIFLTDMEINSGTKDGDQLYKMSKSYADKKIYMTFIGIGVDFNTNLVKQLSSVRATNYLSVQNAKDFKKHMEEEFDYLVTPSVFNISVSMESNQYYAERVYGSPGYEIPTAGKLMYIDSTFPSPQDKEEMSKGGIVLAKLKKKSDQVENNSQVEKLKFHLSYEDRERNLYEETREIEVPSVPTTEELFQENSVQKGVLLVRYVNFMKQFLRNSQHPTISSSTGISIPEIVKKDTGSKHVPLKPLTEEWKSLFDVMMKHFEKQMDEIDDPILEKEYKQMLKIYETK